MNVGAMGNSTDEPGIYDQTWRRFLEESEFLGGRGVKRFPVSLDVLPPKLIGKIGTRPDRVGKGKIRDWGISRRKVGCGEEWRTRAEREGR